MKYFALPNHQVKKDGPDYQYLKPLLGDNMESNPEYIAWWSDTLFNVAFVGKLEMFLSNDIPGSKPEIKTEPSKASLKHAAFSGTNPVYSQVNDWEVKTEDKTATYRLRARHLPEHLEKGMELEFITESKKGDNYAMWGVILWLVFMGVFYFAGLGLLVTLGAGVVLGAVLYFAVSALLKKVDSEIPENNAVFECFKKYLLTNFDLEKS